MRTRKQKKSVLFALWETRTETKDGTKKALSYLTAFKSNCSMVLVCFHGKCSCTEPVFPEMSIILSVDHFCIFFPHKTHDHFTAQKLMLLKKHAPIQCFVLSRGASLTELYSDPALEAEWITAEFLLFLRKASVWLKKNIGNAISRERRLARTLRGYGDLFCARVCVPVVK